MYDSFLIKTSDPKNLISNKKSNTIYELKQRQEAELEIVLTILKTYRINNVQKEYCANVDVIS